MERDEATDPTDRALTLDELDRVVGGRVDANGVPVPVVSPDDGDQEDR